MAPPETHDVITTLAWRNRPRWMDAVEVLDVEALSPPAQLRALMRAARSHRVVVLNGSLAGRVQPLAAVAMGRLRRPPRVILTDCTWKAGTPPLSSRARRLALRGLDGPHVSYCVLSSFEREQFARTWGVDPARVRFTPWYVGLPDEVIENPPDGDDGHVFAGGDSLRDYGSLLLAADRVMAPIIIASRTLSPLDHAPNVHAGPVSPERFAHLAGRAATVVVPLEDRHDRSAGQFTYLNAMALGKPVVVTDAPGVRDYIDHGRTGLVVAPGDATGLTDAINWTLNAETRPAALAMGSRAREDVLRRFSADRYVACLLDVVAEVQADERREPVGVSARVGEPPPPGLASN